MRCLKIPNTKQFQDITQIEDAYARTSPLLSRVCVNDCVRVNRGSLWPMRVVSDAVPVRYSLSLIDWFSLCVPLP